MGGSRKHNLHPTKENEGVPGRSGTCGGTDTACPLEESVSIDPTIGGERECRADLRVGGTSEGSRCWDGGARQTNIKHCKNQHR
jgi:hypothetical protein